MREFVVNSLELMCKIAIVMMLLMGLITGMMTGKLWIALMDIMAWFIFGTVVFGGLFILLDIRDDIRTMRRHFESQSGDRK